MYTNWLIISRLHWTVCLSYCSWYCHCCYCCLHVNVMSDVQTKGKAVFIVYDFGPHSTKATQANPDSLSFIFETSCGLTRINSDSVGLHKNLSLTECVTLKKGNTITDFRRHALFVCILQFLHMVVYIWDDYAFNCSIWNH